MLNQGGGAFGAVVHYSEPEGDLDVEKSKFGFVKEMFKAYLKSLVAFVGGRWVSPRDSQDDPECAVVEIDVDLGADALNYIGVWIALLKQFDPRVNTDHPVFRHLGESAERRQSAPVTFTISLRRREEKKEEVYDGKYSETQT
jgi:hypothetical protein